MKSLNRRDDNFHDKMTAETAERTCSRSLVFSLSLIFTLHWWPLAFLILSPPLQNFHVVLPTKKFLLGFLSLALDLCRPFSR